jgi:hypothetical protein
MHKKIQIPARTLWQCGLLLALLPIKSLILEQRVLLQHDGFLSDLWHSALPYRVFLGAALSRGELPLWMPDLFSGIPFFAQIEAGALYFPNWPVFIFFDPVTALNLSISITTLIAGLGTWYLCKHFGAGNPAATLGGLAFAICGFHIAHFKHMNMHEASAWLPWAVYCLEKALETNRVRWHVRLAMVLAIQFFAGHPQITYYTLVFLIFRTIFFFAYKLTKKKERSGKQWFAIHKNIGLVVISMLLGLGMCAVQIVPILIFNEHSIRNGSINWEFASAFPYFPKDLLTFFFPNANGNFYNYTYSGTLQWENYAYIGIIPLLFTFVAVVNRPDPNRLFWTATLLLAFVLLLGPLLPLYELLWKILPGMALFRFPTRFMMLLHLSMAVLASLGLTKVLTLFGKRTKLIAGAGVVVIVLHTIDLTVASAPFLPTGSRDVWYPADDLARETDQSGRAMTVYSFEAWKKSWLSNSPLDAGGFDHHAMVPLGSSGVLLGLRTTDGYTNMIDQDLASYWCHYNEHMLTKKYRVPVGAINYRNERGLLPNYLRLLERSNVKWVFSEIQLSNTEFREIAKRDGYYLYRLLTALPRAYVVSSWIGVNNKDEMAEHVYFGDYRPAIIGDSGDGIYEGFRPVEVREISNRELEVDVTNAGEGLLVLTDSFDPDWQVFVDGVAVEMMLANGFQRSVRISNKARTVRFYYTPRGIYTGLLITLLSLAVCFVWIRKGS